MIKFLNTSSLKTFLDKINEQYNTYVPVKKGRSIHFMKYDGSVEDVVVGQVRAFEPLKSFFVKSREKVSEGFSPDCPGGGSKPLAIVGVKACDLKGFKVQDFVFGNSEAPDPFYLRMRENNLIISSDCTCAIDTCFCRALGIKPFPEDNYDINLSQVKDGFIAQSGSPRGEKLLNSLAGVFDTADKDHMFDRDTLRSSVVRAVDKNLTQFDVPHQESFTGMIEKGYDTDIWKDESKTCVECGACNTICPTCHCFLLYDQKNGQDMARYRIWDSCMIKDFARVAGGHNPRKNLWERLRNRFDKKFDYFPKVASVYACTGCGRCVLACPAKIDIRKVLRRLVNNVKAQ